MIETIAKIILSGSLIGIGAIVIRKTSVLVEIPEEEIEKFDWKTPPLKLINRIKNSKIFSSNLVLQKILSKVRILTLMVERKTDDKLQRLRATAKRKKSQESDNYWKELRKAKKRKD